MACAAQYLCNRNKTQKALVQLRSADARREYF